MGAGIGVRVEKKWKGGQAEHDDGHRAMVDRVLTAAAPLFALGL
jgi:hypothetical protein